MDMSGHPQTAPRKRDTVFLMAQIAEPGKPPQRYRVRNLSAEGVCVERLEGLEKFDRLMVSIGQLENVPAEVIWSRGGLAGLKFLRPIDVSLARKHKASGCVPTQAASGPVGWLSEHRRPHQKVWG